MCVKPLDLSSASSSLRTFATTGGPYTTAQYYTQQKKPSSRTYGHRGGIIENTYPLPGGISDIILAGGGGGGDKKGGKKKTGKILN